MSIGHQEPIAHGLQFQRPFLQVICQRQAILGRGVMPILYDGFGIGEFENAVSLWITQEFDLLFEFRYIGLQFEALPHFPLEALTDEL